MCGMKMRKTALYPGFLSFKEREKSESSGKAVPENLRLSMCSAASWKRKAALSKSGKKRTHLQTDSWQNQLLYIPQHPYIFPDTLAANIRFIIPPLLTKTLNRQQELPGSELIDQLPNGLKERIGEGGRALSGGQAQRTAVARAFLGNRPIILLDEPTAHLDIETEYELKNDVKTV